MLFSIFYLKVLQFLLITDLICFPHSQGILDIDSYALFNFHDALCEIASYVIWRLCEHHSCECECCANTSIVNTFKIRLGTLVNLCWANSQYAEIKQYCISAAIEFIFQWTILDFAEGPQAMSSALNFLIRIFKVFWQHSHISCSTYKLPKQTLNTTHLCIQTHSNSHSIETNMTTLKGGRTGKRIDHLTSTSWCCRAYGLILYIPPAGITIWLVMHALFLLNSKRYF